ncbi:hypothetical protein GCM10022381_25800 [Leifsonia kafniensis]|uniref:riboflavin kinase n=1 Tax=Leifsonia kafniensis TaxID=475957 RepID=A0ABP7KQ26_9MICO
MHVDDIITIAGEVIPGDQRGRLLNFPTANISVSPDDVVPDGVWAATTEIDGVTYAAAVSIGVRPTYYAPGTGVRLLEAHIIDFDGDLYGLELVVRLHVLLRLQQRFQGSEHLVRQLKRDVSRTRSWAESVLRAAPTEPQPHGRWGPNQRKSPGINHEARAARLTGERELRIQNAAVEASRRGELSHDFVSELAGVPAGLLRWQYPTTDSLARVASKPSR